jgi:hypothetical protein
MFTSPTTPGSGAGVVVCLGSAVHGELALDAGETPLPPEPPGEAPTLWMPSRSCLSALIDRYRSEPMSAASASVVDRGVRDGGEMSVDAA